MRHERQPRAIKSASELKVQFIGVRPNAARISELKRGQLFLREGMACMRVDVAIRSSCASLNINEGPDHGYWITNLQTGRVWRADDCEVERVSADLLVKVQTVQGD